MTTDQIYSHVFHNWVHNVSAKDTAIELSTRGAQGYTTEWVQEHYDIHDLFDRT